MNIFIFLSNAITVMCYLILIINVFSHISIFIWDLLELAIGDNWQYGDGNYWFDFVLYKD